jgi:hypothetical protein
MFAENGQVFTDRRATGLIRVHVRGGPGACAGTVLFVFAPTSGLRMSVINPEPDIETDALC